MSNMKIERTTYLTYHSNKTTSKTNIKAKFMWKNQSESTSSAINKLKVPIKKVLKKIVYTLQQGVQKVIRNKSLQSDEKL